MIKMKSLYEFSKECVRKKHEKCRWHECNCSCHEIGTGKFRFGDIELGK